MILFNRTSIVVLIFLIGSAAATTVHAADDVEAGVANAAAGDRHLSITRAAARHAAKLSEPDEVVSSTQAALSQFRQGSRARCQSKKKGTLIGAVIGGAAGAAFAVYVNRDVGGVFGTANGANRFLAYWTAGGAAGGALVGFAYCL